LPHLKISPLKGLNKGLTTLNPFKHHYIHTRGTKSIMNSTLGLALVRSRLSYQVKSRWGKDSMSKRGQANLVPKSIAKRGSLCRIYRTWTLTREQFAIDANQM
jgi:hypothetical protein